MATITSTPPPSATPPATPAGGAPAPTSGSVGAAAPADGVDATPSPSGIHGPVTSAGATTLPGIPESFPVAALSKLDAKGVQGDSFMLDAGSLRGLKLQVRRVVDGEDKGFEVVFKVHPAKLAKLLKTMEDRKAERGGVVFRGCDTNDDGLCEYNDKKSEISSSGTHAPKDIDSAAKKWALQLDGPKGGSVEVVHDKAALALRGMVRMHLRGDDKTCTKQLKGMIDSLGLGHLFAPPTPKSKRINMLMRVLWQHDHKAAQKLSKGDPDKLKPAALEKALKKVGFDTDRIAGLRELAKQGPTSSPDQQQRVADQLAESIAAEEDPLVRAEIVRTLAGYGAATATRVLHAAVEDPDEDVRIAACRAWATRGDAEAIAVLGRTLTGDTDVDVRLAAASALGESRDPAAVAALEPALSDKDPALQYRAVLSLRTITGQDFGNDVRRWQQYVRGELPAPPRPVSVVERFRELF